MTVEASEQMDLAEFDRGEHAGVILDEVSDADFLIFLNFLKAS